MPLPKPKLDTRTFDQLVEEGRALLPRLAPVWTDHNTTDPGMTLLELYAWLSEMALYRLDRVPEEMLRAFLRLIGVRRQTALPAQAVLLLEHPVDLNLPAGLQMRDASDSIAFESLDALTVSSAKLTRVLDGAGGDVSAINTAGSGYAPFGVGAARGSAVYFGFDRALAAAGAELSAWVWTLTPADDARTRTRLINEWNNATQLRAETCPATLRQLPPWWLHHDARLRWEYWSSTGQWRALDVLLDETRALTLSGAVRFRAPADHAAGGPEPWLFWLRAHWHAGDYECAPRIARVGFNALRVAHAVRVDDIALGVSHGRADTAFDLRLAPVLARSTELSVDLGGSVDVPWTEVSDWDETGAHDRHYVLDATRGRVVFGNGLRGRVPASGAQLMLRLRQGGGTQGNVPSATLTHWRDNAHNQALVPGWSGLIANLTIAQPFDALGGANAETTRDAVARALTEQCERTRAVNLDDFEVLARDVPGVPVARARAIADYEPSLPCFRAAGRVAVVVIPDCPGPRPTPTPGMLAAVARHLELRRPPACALRVIAPEYTTVRVHATLHARAGIAPAQIERAAIQAIAAFMHPLQGGTEGAGWLPGRAVYRSELLALLGAVPGVLCVTELGIQGEADAAPRCENLPLCQHQLIVPGAHCLRVIGAPPQRIVDRSIVHDCP